MPTVISRAHTRKSASHLKPKGVRDMGKRIAVVGVGALGGYVGGNLAHAGEDVTLIDFWPENIETIRKNGLELDGVTPEEKFTVRNAKTMHLTEMEALSRQKPIDIAFVSMKSYDTEWATQLIKQYLAPDGYIVSLQNCLNEERIAGVVGWGKTVGMVASLISVDMYEPATIRRTVAKGGDKHTVFRVGEVHGRITKRVEELRDMVGRIDSAKTTTNLWGERWSKLCQNGMKNGVSAATGLTGRDCDANDAIRRFSIKLGGEAVRVGQALGYHIEKIGKMEPETLAKAGEGDKGALDEIESILRPGSNINPNPRADIQRPSMAQDIRKGRRTEIEFMNGYIAGRGPFEVGDADRRRPPQHGGDALHARWAGALPFGHRVPHQPGPDRARPLLLCVAGARGLPLHRARLPACLRHPAGPEGSDLHHRSRSAAGRFPPDHRPAQQASQGAARRGRRGRLLERRLLLGAAGGARGDQGRRRLLRRADGRRPAARAQSLPAGLFVDQRAGAAAGRRQRQHAGHGAGAHAGEDHPECARALRADRLSRCRARFRTQIDPVGQSGGDRRRLAADGGLPAREREVATRTDTRPACLRCAGD